MSINPYTSLSLGGARHSTADFSSQGAHDASSPANMASAPEADGSRTPRNIVLCFDGTGNAYGQVNTNVVKMMAVLERESPNQSVYYQAGLGTYGPPGIYNQTILKIAAILDQTIATGYQYLMNKWQEGDRIYLFGFSRGAYTARALAGMLEKVGLLGSGNEEQVAFAYKIFKEHDNLDQAVGFKDTFCRHVKIHFVGVWDTVQSVGFLYGKTLPFARGSDHIGTFRHAIALDERRARFKPELWRKDHDLNNHLMDVIDNKNETVRQKVYHDCEPEVETDVLEVWFAGGHGDVGGGWPDFYKRGHDRICISNIPLRWMIKEAAKQGLLLKPPPQFDDEVIQIDAAVLPLDPLKQKLPDPAVILNAYTPITVDEDKAKQQGGVAMQLFEIKRNNDRLLDESRSPDVLAKTHDVLRSWSIWDQLWWVLEWFPVGITRYLPNGHRRVEFALNLGRARDIPEKSKLHNSVKLRMAAGYRPFAKLPKEYYFVD